MCRIEHRPVHHQAQGSSLGGLGAQTQHGQLCLCQNTGGDLQNEGHNDVGGDVGQDVGEDDTKQAVTGQLGKVNVVTVTQGDDTP